VCSAAGNPDIFGDANESCGLVFVKVVCGESADVFDLVVGDILESNVASVANEAVDFFLDTQDKRLVLWQCADVFDKWCVGEVVSFGWFESVA